MPAPFIVLILFASNFLLSRLDSTLSRTTGYTEVLLRGSTCLEKWPRFNAVYLCLNFNSNLVYLLATKLFKITHRKKCQPVPLSGSNFRERCSEQDGARARPSRPPTWPPAVGFCWSRGGATWKYARACSLLSPRNN